MQVIVIALSCPTELYNKILFSKSPHTILVLVYIKPVLTWKLPACWLAFKMPEGITLHAGKKSQQQSYPAVNPESSNCGWSGVKCALLQQYGNNEALSVWTEILHHKTKLSPALVNWPPIYG